MSGVEKKVGRLAPTPSGQLHLGNVCAFAVAWLSVRKQNGRLLLRMEDVDYQRARPAHADAIRRELNWLGLHWDAEVLPQSQRDYRPALARLSDRTYFCQCSRRELRPYKGRYPGFCREQGFQKGAVRYHLEETSKVDFTDQIFGPQCPFPARTHGDPVLRRHDGLFTYNLAVVADDIADGVSEVVRGADLLDYTGVQIALWRALGAAPPCWLHTPIILDANGKKLAKSQQSVHVEMLQAAGWSPKAVCRTVLQWLGLPQHDTWSEAIADFHPANISRAPVYVLNNEAAVPSPKKGFLWKRVSH